MYIIDTSSPKLGVEEENLCKDGAKFPGSRGDSMTRSSVFSWEDFSCDLQLRISHGGQSSNGRETYNISGGVRTQVEE
jgi:hypothetical protein